MRPLFVFLFAGAVFWTQGCSSPAKPTAAKAVAPAKVDNGGIQEKDLATIRLTADAEKRLGIEVAESAAGRLRLSRTFAGDIVLPPGRITPVASPMTGTIILSTAVIGKTVRKGEPLFSLRPMLAPERNVKGVAKAELDAAKGRVEAAQIRVDRTKKMFADGTGSQRAIDDATQEIIAARAAFEAAQAKWDLLARSAFDADVNIDVSAPASGFIRQVLVEQGQVVPAGAVVCEIADWSRLWVRLPVFTGEASLVKPGAPVRIRPLASSQSREVLVSPVAAPPSADPLAGTVDFYYSLDNSSGGYRPGERLEVRVDTETGVNRVHVPGAAIVRDIHGTAWLYEQTAPLQYTRRRVEVERTTDGQAYLAAGLKAGLKVVTAGAAELFGTEFGAGK